MKIVLAPDSFKESLTAPEACAAMQRGIRAIQPDAEVVAVPMADGGEGTAVTVAAALDGDVREVPVHDATGAPRTGRIGWAAEERLAIIDVAEACGLEHVPAGARNALTADTYGVGELLAAALDLGAERLIVGLGGSATNDAGAGMLRALGARLTSADGHDLAPGGAALADLASVDLLGLRPELARVQVQIASDVDNPLLGERGASAVFGPQKGADPDQVRQLDAALSRWADVMEEAVGRSVRDIPGAGAAGGLGAALLAVTAARIDSGATVVMDAAGLDAALEGADLCLTGEGSFDSQSAAGKVPVRVAQRAHNAGVPTVILAGRVAMEPGEALPDGVIAAVPIIRGVSDLPTALREGGANLEAATATVMRLLTQRT